MTLSALANGYILGWSVAWPPGPINAEMIRRGLLPKDRGGGFWSAWPIGLGACTGDFIWAFGVSVGAGALLTSVEIRRALAIVSASVRQSLAIAVAVVLGALTWGVVLCIALKFGAHVFSHPNWQVATEAITASVMLWFAIRLLLHFP